MSQSSLTGLEKIVLKPTSGVYIIFASKNFELLLRKVLFQAASFLKINT